MLRLENAHPTLGPRGFVFGRDSGVLVSKFDPGFPEVRRVADKIPQQHGMQDYSSFYGARSITINFRIYAPWSKSPTTRRQILDTLSGLANPRLRPFLYESVDDIPERRIMLTVDDGSMPFEQPHTSEVQLSWIAPFGIWESGTLEITEIGPGTGGAATTGRTYPLTFPRSYASRAPSGGKPVINEGNIECYPAFVLYGPCTDATIANTTTGQQMKFVSLNLTSTESVVINARERRIYMAGSEITKYDKVDWTQSEWVYFAPGQNLLAFNPTGYSDVTRLAVAYRHAWSL